MKKLFLSNITVSKKYSNFEAFLHKKKTCSDNAFTARIKRYLIFFSTFSKYDRTSCLEKIKFMTEEYFTKHTNITTIYREK
jgi:hypothetical protein